MALPLQTPEELEQERLQQASEDEARLAQAEASKVDAEQIEKSTPSDLKAMGIAKLPLLLLVIGNQVKQIINPALQNLIQTTLSRFLNTDLCPSQAEIANIKRQRDNIVNQLNRISKTLNIIAITLTGVSTFLNILQVAVRAIDLSKIAAKIAAAAFPPLAATLPVALNTLDQAKTKILIDEKGNARLTKISAIIGGAGLVSAIIGAYILTAVNLLKVIDGVLAKCAPNDSLIPISKETQDIANTQLQAETTQNLTTYQGFIIEIEEVPYTPTVVRRRALGKNQSGIVLIQTELSFTTDNQTLINELKLIIDRDNLKAY
jgi:hypothetical protein